MRSIVVLNAVLSADDAHEVARIAAPHLGQPADRLERLLVSEPGPITKPLDPQLARGVVAVLQRAGADVEVQEAEAGAPAAGLRGSFAPGPPEPSVSRAEAPADAPGSRDAVPSNSEELRSPARSDPAAADSSRESEREAAHEAALEAATRDSAPPQRVHDVPRRPSRTEEGFGGFDGDPDDLDESASTDWSAEAWRSSPAGASSRPASPPATPAPSPSSSPSSSPPSSAPSSPPHSPPSPVPPTLEAADAAPVDAMGPGTGDATQRRPEPERERRSAAEVRPPTPTHDPTDPYENDAFHDREPPLPPREFDWGPSRSRQIRRIVLLGLLAIAIVVLVFLQTNQAGPAAAGAVEFQTGLEAYRHAEFASARRIWETVASSGDPDAMYMLGYMAEAGQGQPWSNRRAAAWYRQAAERGLPEAQIALASLYARGLGVPQSDELAARWYRLAADQGVIEAQLALGHAYQDGRGVPQDFTTAASWFEAAAESGSDEAAAVVAFLRWASSR